MLTDTHAHLDDPVFAEDLDSVLARAADAGVARVITVGTSVASSRQALALAEKFAQVYAVVGIHPHEAEAAEADAIDELRTLARHPKVVALGETGLDFHSLPSRMMPPIPLGSSYLGDLSGPGVQEIQASLRDGAYQAAQAAQFDQQLALAVELGLNVVIHQRAAWEDTLDILRPYTGRLRAAFHCFGESPERARELFAMGHLISFTGLLTFKNAALVRETAAAAPPDCWMVETDCPYLAPVPHRGRRSEPAHTRVVAEALAQARGETLAAIAASTEATAQSFFRFRA